MNSVTECETKYKKTSRIMQSLESVIILHSNLSLTSLREICSLYLSLYNIKDDLTSLYVYSQSLLCKLEASLVSELLQNLEDGVLYSNFYGKLIEFINILCIEKLRNKNNRFICLILRFLTRQNNINQFNFSDEFIDKFIVEDIHRFL